MNTILAIDPGSTESGWVVTRDGVPLVLGSTASDMPIIAAGVSTNPDILEALRIGGIPDTGLLWEIDDVVIEWMQTRQGAPIGASTFETLWWAGRFTEAVEADGGRVSRLGRAKVMRHLCGGPRRKGEPGADALVWQALVDRFGGIGGKEAAVGRKASPGPLYGIASHARAALAVAVTWADMTPDERAEMEP